MLSILIGHSYFLRFDPKQFERAKPYPPLATLQVAALLRQAGHRVALFDAMLAESTQEYELQLRAVEPQLVLFYEDNFNFLSKMCLRKMRLAACAMVESAHRAGARVIVAGSDVSDAPEVYLRAGADAALIGEGLGALSALLARLDANLRTPSARLIEGVAGVAALVDGRPVLHALDAHAADGPPEPGAGPVGKVVALQGARAQAAARLEAATAWELLDVERYRRAWLGGHGYFSLNMAASKGCSFRCAWCAKPIWGNRYQQRSASAVAAEMAHLKRAFKPDHIWFADDIFGFRADWVLAFASAVQAAGGGIPFTIQTRADLVSEGMAQALRDAGCREVWIGAESGSQKILDAMNKGTTVQEILTARSRLAAQGIRVGFFIQLGYLDEQLDDLMATRKLIDEARPDDVGVSVAYPLPGTRFHDEVKAQLGDKTRWDDSGDLAMMFQGTYNSAFYRAVRDLLHLQVEVEKLKLAATADGYRRARSALQQQWASLIAGEGQYRTPLLVAAAA